MNEFANFYVSAMSHVSACLNEGWQKKDSLVLQYCFYFIYDIYIERLHFNRFLKNMLVFLPFLKSIFLIIKAIKKERN